MGVFFPYSGHVWAPCWSSALQPSGRTSRRKVVSNSFLSFVCPNQLIVSWTLNLEIRSRLCCKYCMYCSTFQATNFKRYSASEDAACFMVASVREEVWKCNRQRWPGELYHVDGLLKGALPNHWPTMWVCPYMLYGSEIDRFSHSKMAVGPWVTRALETRKTHSRPQQESWYFEAPWHQIFNFSGGKSWATSKDRHVVLAWPCHVPVISTSFHHFKNHFITMPEGDGKINFQRSTPAPQAASHVGAPAIIAKAMLSSSMEAPSTDTAPQVVIAWFAQGSEPALVLGYS